MDMILKLNVSLEQKSAGSPRVLLVSDALVREGFVKDTNEECVQKLHVSATATDEDI